MPYLIKNRQNAKPNHQLNDQNGSTDHSGGAFADQDFPSDDDSGSDYDLDSNYDSDSDYDSDMEDIETAARTEGDGPDTTGSTEMDSVSAAGQNLTGHTADPPVKEPTARQLKALVALARALLEDPDVNGDVIWEHVRDELLNADKCSERDLRNVADIVTHYREWRFYDATLPYTVYRIRALISLDPIGVYESLCGRQPGRFNVDSPNSVFLISSVERLKLSPQHQQRAIHVFLMWSRLKRSVTVAAWSSLTSLPTSTNLQFNSKDDWFRMEITDIPFTVRMIKNVQKSNDHRDQSIGQRRFRSIQQQAKTAAQEVKVTIADLGSGLRLLNNQLKSAERSHTDMAKILKVCSGSKEERLELYQELQDTRRVVRDLRLDTLPLEHQIRVSCRYNYFYNRLAKAPDSTTTTNTPSSSPPPSYSTLEHPGTHDFVETTSASGHLSQTEERNSELAVGSTDRGLKCMSLTALSKWSTMLELKNRFHLLADDDYFQDKDGEPMEGVEFQEHGSVMVQENSAGDNSQAGTKQQLQAKYNPALPKQRLLGAIKFNKPVKITAPQIREISGSRMIARRREASLRKEENKLVRDANRELSDNSIHNAQTVVEGKEAAQRTPKLSYRTVASHPALDSNLPELGFAMSISTSQASHYAEPDPFAFGYAKLDIGGRPPHTPGIRSPNSRTWHVLAQEFAFGSSAPGHFFN
ncbi:hypothetical protein BGZ47_010618 [Haplosporangium gracile]|nr:hypothetical protein BGZ47_010618 [Haplosporangium gracile]